MDGAYLRALREHAPRSVLQLQHGGPGCGRQEHRHGLHHGRCPGQARLGRLEDLGSAVDNLLHQQVNNLRPWWRRHGLFGGATSQADPELGMVLGSVGQLQAAYQQVITAYSPTAVDFDLEGPTLTSDGSYDGPINTTRRRERSAAPPACRLRQPRRAKLQVWFTLPAHPGTNAPPPSAEYVAIRHRTRRGHAGVNIMTMD